jgi:hypothetical protein
MIRLMGRLTFFYRFFCRRVKENYNIFVVKLSNFNNVYIVLLWINLINSHDFVGFEGYLKNSPSWKVVIIHESLLNNFRPFDTMTTSSLRTFSV